ncbi:MAG TPA: hypothetical protein VJY39_19180 [Acidisphaera sp.]|nr:hypothetical protein [Acidisphaera sp.]HME20902.1 hypothetical protein [Acetobacteraceae bacterium]
MSKNDNDLHVDTDPADASVRIAGYQNGVRLIGYLGRAALDDYLAHYNFPHPTPEQRESFVGYEENRRKVWSMVIRKSEQGDGRPEVRQGTEVRVVRIDASELHHGPRLSAACLIIRKAGWGQGS